MTDSSTTLAIFDFDGTLTEGHLWMGISQHHKAHKIKNNALSWYIVSHLPYYVAAKLKIYPEDKNRAKWGQDLAILFKDFSLQEAHNAFEWITDNYFMPLMRRDMLERLKQHQQQGHKAILLSGMFSDYLETVGKRLGVDYVVGTKLEEIGGKYSGKIIPPLCFAEHKADFLMDFISQQALRVDFESSYAYADSYTDTPVFNLVGHPVAAYPDKPLMKLARSRNWDIISGSQ